MSGTFVITSANSLISLDDKGRGEIVFTTSNSTPRPLRAKAKAVPVSSARQEWLTVAGEPERIFSPRGTQQFIVGIAVPPGTPAERYNFRLDVIADENPDEYFGEGPVVAFDVKPSGAPAKPFPWWIVVAVVGALLVSGVGAWLFWPQEKVMAKQEQEQEQEQQQEPPEEIISAPPVEPASAPAIELVQVPYVVDLNLPAAKQKLESLGLRLNAEGDQSACEGAIHVVEQAPAKDASVEVGSEVKLTLGIPKVIQAGTVFISRVSVNNTGENLAQVARGAVIPVSMSYSISEPGCPTCTDQIQIGLCTGESVGCIYEGIPGAGGKSGTGTIQIKAPDQPGKYPIAFKMAQTRKIAFPFKLPQPYGCASLKGWWGGKPDPSNYIGYVVVK
jgi:hypothetical protein